MTWLYIILISYLILSISNLVDKIFLSKLVRESIVYAVWVTLLSVGAILVVTIAMLVSPTVAAALEPVVGSLSIIPPWFVFISVIVGILFTVAVYLLYTALQKGEASRVLPLIGGSMPVLIYVLTFYYDPLDSKKMIAFVLLVIGTILVSLMPKSKHSKNKMLGTWLGLASSLAFAVFFVMTQYIFRHHGFINGLVWPRLGSAVALVWLLMIPRNRRLMRDSLRHLSPKLKTIWLASQGLGAIGFVGQQYTISIPGVSVALVSALQSVQYVFILIFATLLSIWRPKMLKEYISLGVIIQKTGALLCIAAGLYFIAM